MNTAATFRPATRALRVTALPLAAALLPLVAGACAPGSDSGSSMATQPIEVEGLDNPQRLLQLAQGVTLGDDDAPITILEFADYSCPHCQAFDAQVIPRIDLSYLKEGRAKLVFHDYPLGGFPHSFLAARAARCAGDQGHYWEYHTTLFKNQADWSLGASPPVGKLVDYAGDLGLDTSVFESCVRSDRYADVVTANQRLARELNLNGTPSVLIGQKGEPMPLRIGDPVWEVIAQTVDSLLASG